MVFCIHCGAPNQADAVFCLSCGQILYHERDTTVKKKQENERPHRLLILVLAFVVLTAIIAVLSVKRTVKVNHGASVTLERPRQITASNGQAVLTIVGTNRSGIAVSQGSGFILSSEGLAGSNYHVLEGAAQAIAKCCNGRIFEISSIEGADLEKDLVVFHLYERGSAHPPQDLPHVTLASSSDLAVGERVIAIGSPQGFENTVSDGILSAIREYDSVRYLQITAPISQGSSGGPVLNATGQMIGVATFQFERGQNLNFALAAEHLRPLFDQHFQVSIAEFNSIVRRARRAQRNSSTSKAVDTPPRNQQPAVRPLTGRFDGIVYNQSAGLSSEFGIIVQETEGFLSGCMGVRQPLFGSGPLAGFTADSDVSFVVTSAIGKITLWGHRQDGAIIGTYTVEHEGAPDEKGTFTLKKVAVEGPRSDFDTANCPSDAEINK